MITNCKGQTLDETRDKSTIFFNIENNVYTLNSKKIIICAGAIESCCLILNSLKDKKLRKIKNKKFIGRYFMDHPKCYVVDILFMSVIYE